MSAVERRFVNYGSADGLSSNTVYAIVQDKDNFLWVGTRGGLNRFDGARFQSWKEFGRVNALTVDRQNRLWVGTVEGLYVRDPVRDVFSEGPRGLVRALATDSDGQVWATVGDTLLLRLSYSDGIRTEVRTRYQKRDHEGDYPYFQIFEAPDGKLWLGGRLTSCQYIEDRKHPRICLPLGSGPCLTSYAWDGNRLLAIYDHYNTLCTLEDGKLVTLGKMPVAHARLLTDSRGRLWAAGSYGVALINPDKPEDSPIFRRSQKDHYSLISNELYCIFEDRQGNLWVGGDNGLSVLCPTLQQVRRVSDGQVTALMEDRDGKLWIGLAEDRVSRFYQDRGGTVYVGLWNNTGWEVWKDGRMHKERLSGPTPREQWPSAAESFDGANWIADFLEDSEGRFWVVTWEGVGLNEWDRKAGKMLPPHWLSPFRYPTPQVDSNIYVSSRLGSRVIEDAGGNLVYATTQAGVNIIDKNTGLVTKYHKGNSDIPDNYVTDLCLTPSGTLWAATQSGLWSPSGAHFLDGKLVQSVQADAAGRLWAGTEEGLYFIDTDGSTGVARKELGFPSDIYGEKVSCTLSDGSLAFGGSDGAAVFHPDSLLRAGNGRWQPALTEWVTEGASLQFTFSAENLALAPLIRYRYRLDGVDENWIPADYPQLGGRYNGLFPGRYTLEIQCTDLFGRWQDGALRQSVRIRPPVWLRWPFLLGYLLLLAGAFRLFVRYRENRQRTLVLQAELETRNRFFGIISHDLRNPVSGMKTLAHALEEAPDDRLREGVRAIGKAADHTSDLLENLLMWSLGRQGVLQAVPRTVRLADIVSDAAAGKPIRTEIPEGFTVTTDPDMLTTCLRNLLDNAVRYSPEAGSVVLSADAEKIVIRDHGPGMDEETLRRLSRPGHLGLAITRELVDKMGWRLIARNHPDGGCIITLLFPHHD